MASAPDLVPVHVGFGTPRMMELLDICRAQGRAAYLLEVLPEEERDACLRPLRRQGHAGAGGAGPAAPVRRLHQHGQPGRPAGLRPACRVGARRRGLPASVLLAGPGAHDRRLRVLRAADLARQPHRQPGGAPPCQRVAAHQPVVDRRAPGRRRPRPGSRRTRPPASTIWRWPGRWARRCCRWFAPSGQEDGPIVLRQITITPACHDIVTTHRRYTPHIESRTELDMRRFAADSILVAGITLLGAFLRFWQLDVIPPGLHFDEAFHALQAREILATGRVPVFLEGNFGVPPMFAALVSLSYGVFGQTPLALRAVSALVGTLTIPLLYLLVREVLGSRPLAPAVGLPAGHLVPGHPLQPGGAGALPGAVLPGPVPLAAVARLAHRWLARLSVWRAGLWPGFLHLPGLLAGAAAAGRRAGLAGSCPTAQRCAGCWRQILVFGLAAFLVVAPLAAYFVSQGTPAQRLAMIAATNPQTREQGLDQTLLQNLAASAQMFTLRGDHDPRNNLPGRPMLDPVQSLGFLAGPGGLPGALAAAGLRLVAALAGGDGAAHGAQRVRAALSPGHRPAAGRHRCSAPSGSSRLWQGLKQRLPAHAWRRAVPDGAPGSWPVDQRLRQLSRLLRPPGAHQRVLLRL